MYDFLRGRVAARTPTTLVLDVGGVGYCLTIPLTSYERFPAEGEATAYTHLHVREDMLRLYGFATVEERKLYELLLTVSGIGPTVALGVVSGVSLDDFRELVVAEDVTGLTRMKGVGKKLAQRIVVELKDLLRRLPPAGATRGPASAVSGPAFEDALLALMALGYTRAASEKAIARALKQVDDPADVSAVVQAALRFAG